MADVVVASQAPHNIAVPWHDAGCSTVPIRPDGSKAPDRDWKDLQHRSVRPVTWPEGHGVAVICGKVSANLEMLELESAWTGAHSLERIANQMDSDTLDLWDFLTNNGYSEWSPSGGLHIMYRISDHDVPGNTKIASEYVADRTPKLKTKAETRGEGGYVIVAPTNGSCHPSGEPWEALAGSPDTIPTISWAQRQSVVQAIARALDETPPPPAPSPKRALAVRPAGTLSPGDDFSLRTDWAEILEPEGWTLHPGGPAGERWWVRPGKKWADGHSATTHDDDPGLWVFSTSTDLPHEQPLTKFFVWSHYHAQGDMVAGARELRAQGFGTPLAPRLSDATFMGEPDEPVAEVVTAFEEAEKGLTKAPERSLRPHTYTDCGMTDLLAAEFKDRFRFSPLRNKWLYWDEKGEWRVDYQAVILGKYVKTSIYQMLEQAKETNNESLTKFALRCLTSARISAAINLLKSELWIHLEEFDKDPNKLNTSNGLLDLTTLELEPHKPEHYCTKMMGADYDPEASAPAFQKYLDEVLPDPALQDYVQRAAGYTLLGEPVERSLVVLHGPKGTGKSKFVETMNMILGGYATTAASSLFQVKRDSSGPSNDLNDLRNMRLASVSELDPSIRMDEALVKRLTGYDRITSRGLYEENQSWMPRCVIWLATNHLFRIDPSDGATWDRIKIVSFNEVPPDKDPFLLKRFEDEAAGILNWILEGLRKYREVGLDAPEPVRAAVQVHRNDQDSVTTFVEEMVDSGRFTKEPQARMASNQMYAQYRSWCQENFIDRPVSNQHFPRRMLEIGYERVKSHGERMFVGLRKVMVANLELEDGR
jgi:putative DNA primase/helicase